MRIDIQALLARQAVVMRESLRTRRADSEPIAPASPGAPEHWSRTEAGREEGMGGSTGGCKGL